MFLNAPTSALTAVINLAPAIMDEPRRLADLAERARPGNGATVYAYLRDQPHGYAMPITRVREYPVHPLNVLREQIPYFPHPRGYTVIDDDSPLASVYDTFTANPPLREMTLSTRTMGTSSMTDSTDPSPAGGLRIGSCQPPEILADTEAALAWIEDFARQGAEKDVDLLLFPECFLQGYLFDPDHVSRHAMDFTSPTFTAVLRRLAPIEATVVVGVIETEHGRYFNTAAVITGGRLIGRYRKTRLMPGETIFDPGDTYPTFVQGGVRRHQHLLRHAVPGTRRTGRRAGCAGVAGRRTEHAAPPGRGPVQGSAPQHASRPGPRDRHVAGVLRCHRGARRLADRLRPYQRPLTTRRGREAGTTDDNRHDRRGDQLTPASARCSS